MKIGFIGDIVGKPGREMIKNHLGYLREEFGLDFVIANGENASHGFGLSKKNADELFGYGIDVITGGNHIWDKKDIIPLLNDIAVLRPANYPDITPGRGVEVFEVTNEKLAVINLMGHFTMPMANNPFLSIQEIIKELKTNNIENIFIDFHAEATSEKRALFCMLRGEVSAICGTHTHIGTDDMMVENGTFYVSDVGLSGCRDAVIGMDKKEPLQRFTIGYSSSFDIPKKCKKILQMVVLDIFDGKCTNAKKVKIYDDKEQMVISEALQENYTKESGGNYHF